MLTDEELPSSSVVDLFESMQLKRRSPVNIPRQRCYTALLVLRPPPLCYSVFCSLYLDV